MSNIKRLRITSLSVWNSSKLTIGDSDIIIPFYEATINLKAGELNTITLTAPIEALDVSAELSESEITIVGGNATPGHES